MRVAKVKSFLFYGFNPRGDLHTFGKTHHEFCIDPNYEKKENFVFRASRHGDIRAGVGRRFVKGLNYFL
jgi:hypothetical protein